MKWICFFIASFLLQTQFVLAGEDAQSPFQKAKQAHFEKRHEDAIKILNQEIKKSPENPSLYFNLGLSYKAEKEYPKAIWAFEKALKLQPNDEESIQLINACYSEMGSNKTWSAEQGTLSRALYSLGSDFWSLLAISLSVITAFFIVRTVRAKAISRKKVQLGLAVTCGVLLLVSIYVASESHDFEHAHNYAIVVEDNVPYYNSANASKADTSSLLLPAGSKVQILEWNEKGRSSIKTPKGRVVFVDEGIARI